MELKKIIDLKALFSGLKTNETGIKGTGADSSASIFGSGYNNSEAKGTVGPKGQEGPKGPEGSDCQECPEAPGLPSTIGSKGKPGLLGEIKNKGFFGKLGDFFKGLFSKKEADKPREFNATDHDDPKCADDYKNGKLDHDGCKTAVASIPEPISTRDSDPPMPTQGPELPPGWN